MIDLADLPDDLLWSVTAYLSATDIVACLHVSRAWRDAFSQPGLCKGFLRRLFGRAREVREILGGQLDKGRRWSELSVSRTGSESGEGEEGRDVHSHDGIARWRRGAAGADMARDEAEDEHEEYDDVYFKTFIRVARRYRRLSTATPGVVERLALKVPKEYRYDQRWEGDARDNISSQDLDTDPRSEGSQRQIAAQRDKVNRPLRSWLSYYSVSPWQRRLRFESSIISMPFDPVDTLWTYDDGLLVFPSRRARSYVVYDVERGHLSKLDLECESRVIRRVRLCQKTLVVEWCEKEAYHQLNESEVVFRHFATAYDLVCSSPFASPLQQLGYTDEEAELAKWNVQLRNEWKIHFLGLPLNRRDRFFSIHTPTHYALYLWQPNRSAWGEDEPIEGLAVWDISSPSSYRPSHDSTGKAKPHDSFGGPRLLRRYSMAEMGFYGVRQRETPTLTNLGVDEGSVYLHMEDHHHLVGQQVSLRRPRLHSVKTIAVPFSTGPHSVDVCGAATSDSNHYPSLCNRGTYDETDLRLARCWRHNRFPYLNASQVHDIDAGVKISLSHCIMLMHVKPGRKVEVVTPIREPDHMLPGMDKELIKEFSGAEKIAGDERFVIGQSPAGDLVIAWFDDRPSPADERGNGLVTWPRRKRRLRTKAFDDFSLGTMGQLDKNSNAALSAHYGSHHNRSPDSNSIQLFVLLRTQRAS